jgi:hypothetical protein
MKDTALECLYEWIAKQRERALIASVDRDGLAVMVSIEED